MRRRTSATQVCAVALLIVAVIALVGGARPALAARSDAKAIWGPVSINGKSQFPLYHALGAGIYQASLAWQTSHPLGPQTRPIRATRHTSGPPTSPAQSSRPRTTT